MMQSLGMDFPDQMNSINEVQRLIGLSLSKIQIGRSQRGGLPLHRNLLVATVLSKARDLYMQETMYMNYKIMSAQQRLGNNSEQHHFGVKSRFPDGNHIDQMENDDAIDNVCDADEESDSDVDDDDDDDEMINDPEASSSQLPYRVSTIAAMMMQAAVAAASTTTSMNQVAAAAAAAASNVNSSAVNYPTSQSKVEECSNDDMSGISQQYNYNSSQPAFMPSAKRYLPDNHLLSHQSYLLEDRFPSSTQQHYHNHLQSSSGPPSPTRPVSPLLQHADVRRLDDPMPQRLSSRDEGFIDDHDCDCEARNFSTLETHMPFQYCYNCAHFQSANGRGPTLVPSPPACPTSLPTDHQVHSILNVNSSSNTNAINNNRANQTASVAHSPPEGDFTIYDMDSKSTEFKKPMSSPPPPARQAAKRTRMAENEQDPPKKPCLRTKREPDSKMDNSQPSQANEPCHHPAYRYDGTSTSSSPQAMEIDQITSLVSIFSFGQHIVTPSEGSPNAILSSESPDPIASSYGSEDTSKSQCDNSDSESDTSSDSGHFGDELDTSCGKSQSQDQDAGGGEPLVVISLNASEQELKKIQLASDHPTSDSFNCTQAIISSKTTSLSANVVPSFDPEDENPDDDSDTKSDKSSDSGHSSDDSDNTLELSITTDNLVQTIIKGSKVLPPTTECVCSTKSC